MGNNESADVYMRLNFLVSHQLDDDFPQYVKPFNFKCHVLCTQKEVTIARDIILAYLSFIFSNNIYNILKANIREIVFIYLIYRLLSYRVYYGSPNQNNIKTLISIALETAERRNDTNRAFSQEKGDYFTHFEFLPIQSTSFSIYR